MKRSTPLAEIAAQVWVFRLDCLARAQRPELVSRETRIAIMIAAKKAGYVGARDADGQAGKGSVSASSCPTSRTRSSPSS